MNHDKLPSWKRRMAQLLLWPGAAGVGLAAGSALWGQDGDPLPPVPDATTVDLKPAAADPASDQARVLMLQSSEAYKLRDYARSRELALRAAALNAKYQPGDETPEQLLRRISERTGLPTGLPASRPSTASRVERPVAAIPRPTSPTTAPRVEPIQKVSSSPYGGRGDEMPKTPETPYARKGDEMTRTSVSPYGQKRDEKPKFSPPPAKNLSPAQLLKAGRDALEVGKLEMAQDLGNQAEALKPSRTWGFFDDTPASLQSDVRKAMAKRDRAKAESLLRDARTIVAKQSGSNEERLASLGEAQEMALQSERLHGPYSIWDLGDRPSKVIAEIETSRLKLKNAIARSGGRPSKGSSAEPDRVVGGMPLKKDAPPLDATPIATEDAKKQALALMAEAKELRDKGLYPEAKAKLLAASHLRATFATDEMTPGKATQDLNGEVLRKIAELCNSASALTLTNEFDKSDAMLDQAQGLADKLGLDAAAVKEHRVANASRKANSLPKPAVETPAIAVKMPAKADVPAAVEPMAEIKVAAVPSVPDVTMPADPVPSKGQALLAQARLELRRGDNEAARRMALEAASGQGVDQEAQNLLRTIASEVSTQASNTALKSYEAGVEAFRGGHYRQALAVFQLIDPSLLPASKQQSAQELTIQAAAKVRAEEGDAVATLTPAQGTDTPGMLQPAIPTPVAGQPDNLMRQQEAMQTVQFQKLRSEGLKLSKEAMTRFEAGETDEAINTLKDFVARVKSAGFEPSRTVLLTQAIENRVATWELLKHQKDVVTNLDRKHENFKADQNARVSAKQKKEEEMVRLLKDYQGLMQGHKYQEAGRVADMMRELDPDNPIVVAAVSMARTAYRQGIWDAIKSDKEKWNWEQGNENHRFGPSLTSKDPIAVDQEKLRSILATRGQYAGPGAGIHAVRPVTERENQIEQKLRSMPIDLNFRQTPLSDVIQDIQAKTGINITIAREVSDENVNMKLPITEKLTDLPLRDAIDIVLKQARLTYVVENNVLKVTTEKGARGKLNLRTYAVSDLVIPIESVETPRTASLTAMLEHHLEKTGATVGTQAYTPTFSAQGGASVGTPTGGPGKITSQPSDVTISLGRGTRHKVLIDTITNVIRPDSWDTAGGSGHIEYNPLAFALVVSQTPDVLEQVDQLLDQLRQLQDVEVAIEVRLISLAETFYERIGVDFALNVKTNTTNQEPNITSGNFRPTPFVNDNNLKGTTIGLTPAGIGSFTSDLDVPIRATSFNYAIPPFGGFPNNPAASGGIAVGLAFLNDIQVQLFLEAAQGDRRTNVMQAPKLTMFNGQSATISIGDQQFFVTGVQVLAIGGQVVFSPQSQPFPLNVQMTLQPAVSGDRRFVRINVNLQMTNLASATVPLFPVTTSVQTFFDGNFPGPTVPLTQFIQLPTFQQIQIQTTVAVPDGGTVILGGIKTLSEGRNEFGPPVLSKIPYVSRLFKNVGYGREAQSLLMMITPRIILNREEEFKQTGLISGVDQALTDTEPRNN